MLVTIAKNGVTFWKVQALEKCPHSGILIKIIYTDVKKINSQTFKVNVNNFKSVNYGNTVLSGCVKIQT